MAEKKVVFIVAHDGYQPIEYNTPKEIVEAAGIHVTTGSNEPGTAKAKDGSTVPVEVTTALLDPAAYDGIFFIGGSGALMHLDNQLSYRVIREALKSNIAVGAICIATRILAKAGMLTGKKATGWNGDGALEDIYQDHHVIYIKEPVVIDGNCITAVGPDAAEAFGKAIVATLTPN